MCDKRQILFAPAEHFLRTLRRVRLQGRANGMVEDPIDDVERLSLQTQTVRIRQVMDTASQNVVLRDDLFDIERILDTLESVRGRTALRIRLRDRQLGAIVDIGLPGMDGYEVARRLRKAAPDRRLYLLAMTGYGREEDRQLALAAGFDEHMVKPANMDQLERMLAPGAGAAKQ